MISRKAMGARLYTINSYIQNAEQAASLEAAEQWYRRAAAERAALERLIQIENFLDYLFGPEEGVDGEKEKEKKGAQPMGAARSSPRISS